ncbi:hypothetical protein V492_04017 [Pseudogymnoascus sp. VKM F-4246]|nr:hypothetical protein V492_04017 [Pseudogymnoascus sp. VKM F-4246]
MWRISPLLVGESTGDIHEPSSIRGAVIASTCRLGGCLLKATTRGLFSRSTRDADADEKTLCGNDDQTTLPIRDREKKDLPDDETDESISLTLHPLPDMGGVIVSVHPPKGKRRTPCDVVLVIDVSGSMSTKAPSPETAAGETEVNGLTVLDLTKHAARAIVETLNDDDRLGIVTFSDEIKIVQRLKPMTKWNKTAAWNNIKNIHADGLTNIWQGILQGRSLFEDEPRPGSVPALMLLTDGAPNVGCPPQGYVPQLRMYDLPAPIHTFGFGSQIGSSLLQSIAEVASGNFAYISDPSMLATVFIHAIANLQSTFAMSATLAIEGSHGLQLAETMGNYITKENTVDQPELPKDKLIIPLGGLQYGQSRDIFLKYGPFEQGDEKPIIKAELQCRPLIDTVGSCLKSCSVLDSPNMQPEEIGFHRNRATVCEYLSSLAPFSKTSERTRANLGAVELQRCSLQNKIVAIRAMVLDDDANIGLLEDLEGQILLAHSKNYFGGWGFHYLMSMYNAHFKQVRNSFKDPGPQTYGKDSPVFLEAIKELSLLFDTLPAPTPFVTVRDSTGRSRRVNMVMSSYNRSSNPCFAAECTVKLADGTKAEVRSLKKDTALWTPKGARKLVGILETAVVEEPMSTIGDLVITPWHPVSVDGKWSFPGQIAESTTQYTGKIYSLLLEQDGDSDAHAVEVGGKLAVTLGHGITGAAGDDVRAHDFFGDYEKVLEGLQTLPVQEGVHASGGLQRVEETGLVSGILWRSPLSELHPIHDSWAKTDSAPYNRTEKKLQKPEDRHVDATTLMHIGLAYVDDAPAANGVAFRNKDINKSYNGHLPRVLLLSETNITMHLFKILGTALLFSAATYAERIPVWSVVITTPEQPTCHPDSSGFFKTGGADMTVFASFSPKSACYNLADLFSPSGLAPLQKCYPGNTTCDFQIQDHSVYNDTATYSRVGFYIGVSPGTEDNKTLPSALTFRTFDGADCASDAGDQWHQWRCDDFKGSCETLPYNVQSFSISPTPEENKTGCFLASERGENKVPSEGEGAGVRAGPGSAVVALAAAVGVALLM